MAKADRELVIRLTEGAISGDRAAAADLLPLLYDELRALARQHVAREQPGHTLQATALVNEVYLRLLGTEDPGWDGRGQFFAAAASAMRRILAFLRMCGSASAARSPLMAPSVRRITSSRSALAMMS